MVIGDELVGWRFLCEAPVHSRVIDHWPMKAEEAEATSRVWTAVSSQYNKRTFGVSFRETAHFPIPGVKYVPWFLAVQMGRADWSGTGPNYHTAERRSKTHFQEALYRVILQIKSGICAQRLSPNTVRQRKGSPTGKTSPIFSTRLGELSRIWWPTTLTASFSNFFCIINCLMLLFPCFCFCLSTVRDIEPSGMGHSAGAWL